MLKPKQKSIIDLATLRVIDPPTMAITEVVQGVYCGVDTRNGEIIYVGLSEHLRNRVYQHVQQLKRRSKHKRLWDEDFKVNPELISWVLLEEVSDRALLNERELYWWETLAKPRLNFNKISPKHFKTGGDTRKKSPGIAELLNLVDQGMKAPEIARKLGVTKSSVYGWFRDAGMPLHKFAKERSANSLAQKTRDWLSKPVNVQQLRKELKLGSSVFAACNKHGLSRNIVYEVLELPINHRKSD